MASASMQHSDLEVVHGGISESDPGIQVRVETGMIPVRQHYELEVADSGGRSNDGSTPEATELMSKEQIMEKGKWSFKAFSRRQRWLVIGETLTLVLLIVLASILGVVMNSREHKSLSPSTTSPTAEDTSTSILASASASGSASPPTTQSTATGTASSNLIRNIAAVSHTSNSVNITRLYYQDGSGQLIEATTSDSSSSTTPTWTTNKLNYTAINGSAIAAAVTKPGVEPMEITLAFLGTKNILHSIRSTLNNSTSTITDTNSWTSGSLSLQNISVYSATRLSVLYNPCIDCKYNIIVSYQAPDGNIYIKNQTTSTATDVDTRDNSADSWNTEFTFGVQFGTAMALQKVNSNGIDRAGLYWQWKGSNITIEDWYPGIGWVGTGHWLTESFYSYPNLTPISTGSTDQVIETGYRAWFVLLTLCDTGVRMDVWGGRADTWILINHHPDEMSNSTTNKKVYKDIKVTDLGIAFLVTNNGTAADIVEMWRLGDDMVSWVSLGTVDLGGAWG